MPTSRSYHSYLIESLKDPQRAAAYLDAVLEDGSFEEVRLALSNVAEAQIAALGSRELAANQEAAQQLLSQSSELDFFTLLKLLNELGFKIVVLPKQVA